MRSRARELRRGQTLAERKLWQRLRLRQVCCVRFLRQYVVGGFILDFYAPSIRLAIELDGGQHYERGAHGRDNARSRWLASRGVEVLRYSNLDVMRRMNDVLRDVERTVVRLQQGIPPPLRGDPLRAEGGEDAGPLVPKGGGDAGHLGAEGGEDTGPLVPKGGGDAGPLGAEGVTALPPSAGRGIEGDGFDGS